MDKWLSKRDLRYACAELERSLTYKRTALEFLRDSSIGISAPVYGIRGGGSSSVSDPADKIVFMLDLEEDIKRDQKRLIYLYGKLAAMG